VARLSIRILLSLLILVPTLHYGVSAYAADGDLGLSLDVLPSTDPEISRLTQGQALWFVIPPGESKSRQVRVTSSAAVSEEITLSIGYLNRIDGVPTIDDSKESQTKSWAKFSSKNFTLKPRESKIVDFTYSIPLDTDIGIHEAFLYATARSVQRTSTEEYRVPQNARIASPIFLGIGTSLQISTDFTIDDVSGVVIDGIRQLKIDFKNIGKTPLSLSGSIQLSSAEFQNNLVGPLPFTSVVIRPGVLGYVLVPAPEQLTPGKWKIFVSATQISITKTREFTKELTFKPPSALLINAVKGLAALVFFALFVFAIRLFRKPRLTSVEENNKQPRNSRFLKFRKTHDILKDTSSEIAEIDALIDEILSRRKTAKKLSTKTLVKKSTARKGGVAKKAITKKSEKKVVPKKKINAKSRLVKKSVATKSMTTKKVTKKSVART
jgi:hypothetical protein